MTTTQQNRSRAPGAAEGRDNQNTLYDTQPKKLISWYFTHFLISHSFLDISQSLNKCPTGVFIDNVQRFMSIGPIQSNKNNPVWHPINPLSISEQMSYRVILWTTFRDSCPLDQSNTIQKQSNQNNPVWHPTKPLSISQQMSYRGFYRQVQRSWPLDESNPIKNNPVWQPLNRTEAAPPERPKAATYKIPCRTIQPKNSFLDIPLIYRYFTISEQMSYR